MKRKFMGMWLICLLLSAAIPCGASSLPQVSLSPVADAHPGDVVTFRGDSDLDSMTLRVIRPDQVVMYLDVLTAGTFTETLTLPQDAAEGSYTVIAGQGSVTATTRFRVSAVSGAVPVPTPQTTPVADASDLQVRTSGNQVVATARTVATLTGHSARATFSDGLLRSAVKQAVEGAEKKGGGASPSVVLRADQTAGASEVLLNIPKGAVSLVSDGSVHRLTVASPLAELTFDRQALAGFASAVTGDISFRAAQVPEAQLPEQARAALAGRPVYKFTVTTGDQTVSQFSGNISVTVPYTLAQGENPDSVVVYYVDAAGRMEPVNSGVYHPESRSVTFRTRHFSDYAVGYHPVHFSDVTADSWYAGAVEMIAAREITSGTSSQTFSPEQTLTRGQFLVLMMKTFGLSPDVPGSANFADCGDTYYTGYLAAARRTGIAGGTGNNRYEPDKEISRQEMFTLLFRLLRNTEQMPPLVSQKTLADFSDAQSLPDWSREAALALVQSGVVAGSDGGIQGSGAVTRGQMAQVISNLLTRVQE